MGKLLYSPTFGEVEKRAVELIKVLREKNLKIGFVENSLGGFMSSSIVRHRGASKIFAGSIIPYSYEMKRSFGLSSPKGAVSEDFTNICARWFLKRSDADVVVSESSILGPDGGTQEKPVGLSFVSIYSRRSNVSFVNLFKGDREKITSEVCAFCLFAARKHIIGWELQNRTVASTFIEYKNKILIMKRSQRVGTYRRMWGVASGHVEKNETPLQTALKEVEEETSIKAKWVKKIIQGTPFEMIDEEIGIRWYIYPFRMIVKTSVESIVKIDWEHTSYRMIEPSDIHRYKTAPMLYEGYLKTVFNF